MDRLKPLIAAVLFLVSGWAGSPAAARTVGLVFDDSGSMGPSIQLPAFGVQLLVSTLDGRDGHDRLFAMKLSDTSVTKFDLRTQDRIGFTINQIRQGWTTAHGSTPYGPIALMLDTLVRETGDEEKAYLVVVTDGGFDPNLPSPDALRASYLRLKQQMKGQLRVLFLFIDRGTGERNLAEQQKVYTTLLDVFGGDKDDDVRFVNNATQLKEAMVHFVAKISETDLDRNNSVMRRSGNAIELSLPFSVTRIISLGIGPDSSPPPHVVGRDFQAEALEFQPSMANKDGYFPTRLIGNVTQLRMEPALGTGSHRVEFSGPVGDETVLLFRSEIGLRWKLFDGTREISAVPPAPITATQNRKYKVVVQVQDRVAGADVVLPSKIPDAVVTATVITPSGSIRVLTLKPSDTDKGFIGDVVFDTEGNYEIRTGLRLPGFVTDRIDPVFVNVVARAFDLAMRLQRVESCPVPTDCPDGVLPARVRAANEAAGAVGYIDVTGTPPPKRSGQFRLDIANLETGFEVVGPDGQPVRPNSLYALSAGQTVRFSIVRPARWRPALGTTAVPAQTAVKAVAAQPLEGEATVAFRIQPNLPDPILRYRGHDQDRDGLRPLTLELPGSEQGRQAFDFYVENTLELPTETNISTSFSSGLIGLLTKATVRIPRPGSDGASGYAFSVHPKLSSWCQCFVGLALLTGMSPDTTVTVTYDPRDGRPPTSAEAPLRFTTEGWSVLSLWSGCLWLLIVILLIAYILRVGYALLAAQRFPRSSRFYIFDVGQTEPLAKKVRNSFWSDLRWALVTRVPRHHYRLDGLIVEADAGGQLRMRTANHDWPNFYSARHGKLLQEVAEQMAKRHQAVRAADAIIPMSWDRMIEDPVPGGRRIVFVRNFARRPETAITRELTV